MITFHKLTKFAIFFILLLAFVVRLYHFTYPVADWHSWRQVDTSAVSRNFVERGFDLLHPRYEDISNIPSGIENPNGYRFLEFPIYNIFQAGGYLLFDHFTIEEWGRIVSIFAALMAIVFIYLFCKKYAGSIAAIFASFFYCIDPFNIYYNRTLLPDTLMISVTLGGIYFFDKWVEISKLKSKSSNLKELIFLFLAIIFLAVALLLKPFAAFFLLPVVYIAFKSFGFRTFINWKLWVIAIFSITPLAFWRIWMLQYPEGIASSNWLFNAGNIRFTGAYFNWLFARRIGLLILGYWGIAIFTTGFIVKQKNKILFLTFIVSSLLYMTVIARGNVQHGYYQIPVIPSIAIFFGLGSSLFLEKHSELTSRWLRIPIYVICVLFMLAFSWYNVRSYYDINNMAIVRAGAAVDMLTPKNAKIIAPYNGDTTLLYYTHRQGWPSFEHSTDKLIKLGADYLVLINPHPTDYDIGKKYKIVSATSDYILFDLHQKP